jgi:pyruvate,water dikinase
MTTPDWEPLMKISSGIITNKGGKTCHAAIVARELGINAIVGTTIATKILKNDCNITMDCSSGETATIYNGIINFKINKIKIDTNKKLPIKLMMNIGSPDNSFNASLLPNDGVGLARLEFIISNYIKIHPLALLNFSKLNVKIQQIINKLIYNYKNPTEYFIIKLARGIAKIATAFYPKQVIVRLSDFKSNEYKNLIGGTLFEPNEENPMIGWRGASRYYSEDYKDAFILECKALYYAINNMKCDNITIMIPFCRTPLECSKVIKIMEDNGLKKDVNGLQIYIMCEIPSNVIEADNFSKYVNGVSIGGNDLLQLSLGIDRDSAKIANLTNDTNITFRRLISSAIKTYKNNNVKIGFCGQQCSDNIEFCKFLINEGIDSISVTSDSILKIIQLI